MTPSQEGSDAEAAAVGAVNTAVATTPPLPMKMKPNNDKESLSRELSPEPTSSLDTFKQIDSSGFSVAVSTSKNVPLNGNNNRSAKTAEELSDDTPPVEVNEVAGAADVPNSDESSLQQPPLIGAPAVIEETTTTTASTTMTSSLPLADFVVDTKHQLSSSLTSSPEQQQIAAEEEKQQEDALLTAALPVPLPSSQSSSLKDTITNTAATSNATTAIPPPLSTANNQIRPKISEKSPRKENDWLRSPTSIGDGYSKIVMEVDKLRQILVVVQQEEGVHQQPQHQQQTTHTCDDDDDINVVGSKPPPPVAEEAGSPAADSVLAAPSRPGCNSVMGKIGLWINGVAAKSPSRDVQLNDEIQQQQSEEERQAKGINLQQEEEVERQVIKKRMEIIEQHAKSLMSSQRSGFLNTTYDLPELVSKELDLLKCQLDRLLDCRSSDGGRTTAQTNHDDDDALWNEQRKNQLEQVRETYDSIKSFSLELASKLEHEIQKFTENRKVKVTEGQGPATAVLPTGEGKITSLDDQPSTTAAATSSSATTAATSSTESQKKKRKRVGAKCLAKVRQSWEMSNGVTASNGTATNTTRNTTRRMQFLSSSSSMDGSINFRIRDTYDKSLSEIIANVPDSDDVTNGSPSQMTKKAPYVSYETINGVIPTMAPPMFEGQPVPPDYAAAFGRNNKKRKKGGLRESSGSATSSVDGVAGNSTSQQPKSKRFRRSNDSSASTDAAATAAVTAAAALLPSPSSRDTLPNLHVRILPDVTPKPKVAYVQGDTNPNRLCNPLLRLPQFPDGIDPPIEEIPQGAELWNLADLHYYDPDTYPISYLARLLGFDVPEEGVDQPFGEPFDPMSTKMMKDDTDPWMCVPNRGSFFDRIWKKGDRIEANGEVDDMKLSYCDPLWANIISSYRGFNDRDFKDAGKGFSDDLLPDCLNFARERGILSKEEGLSFRFGTPEDEELLQALADKCCWKSHPRHDLATCLRGQSSFCIVAQSAESGPIAFIQYSFCWYRVEEKISASSGAEKVSELVLFLDALVYDTDMCSDTEGPNVTSQDDLECVKTLLTSLALVHAARANIWYGMVDSPTPLVSFFTKYFRMSKTGREIDDAVMLVFDLKKCHFRFAILLLEEHLKMRELVKSEQLNAGASERMIVRLPTSAFELNNNVSSASKDLRSKKAHIRLVQGVNQTEMLSVSAATTEEEESITLVDPNNIDVNFPSQWHVLRLFPLGPKKSLENGSTAVSPTDGCSEELEKMQKELATLEASIDGTARGLLTKVYQEASEFYRNGCAAKRQQDEKTVEEYETVQKRLKEADLAWQAQLDQDMDAVCDICFDGEVTPENQIIFCDTCNVAVHQGCYGIDKVPSGNYFCRACTHFDIDKEFLAAERRRGPRTKPTRPHINCELCPRRNGAFVLVQSPEPIGDHESNEKPRKAKWVHVSCAKWHGMNYVDIELKDKIEDVSGLKDWFKAAGHQCCLCESSIGAMHQCRQEGCGKWLHLTCGRSIGTCSVQHGENCFGFYDETKLNNPPWTLACPKHSDVDTESIRDDSLTLEQLVTIAKSYPPEPVPPKPFYKMSGAERVEYWSDRGNLKEFFGKVMSNLSGAKCAICEMAHDPNDPNSANQFCPKCGVFSHAECADPARGEDGICFSCRFVDDNKNSNDYVEPKCQLCNISNPTGGPLVKTFAKPMSMKKWKENKAAFKRSLYGPNNFCHTLCGLWNNLCSILDDGQVIDCFNIIMSDGRRHVTHNHRCRLCGKYNGAKVNCYEDSCITPGGRKKPWFHVTCARQAGLQVSADPEYVLACFQHSDNNNVFRARLEDFMEIEIMRYSEKAQMKNILKTNNPMSWDHASKLFHSSVNVLRTLGWAWRWTEWWVESGDNWEPLIRDDQIEEEMSDKELKIVESTPESRCSDARRCRLAAFGAALRNRDYDKVVGDDQEPLERALMAVMSTPSLVGPLKQKEKEFYVTWLSLAYRSASPNLGFGDHKTPVASDSFCVHQSDGSPKFELGSRPLPGKTPPEKENGIFEPLVDEPDDFLKKLTPGE